MEVNRGFKKRGDMTPEEKAADNRAKKARMRGKGGGGMFPASDNLKKGEKFDPDTEQQLDGWAAAMFIEDLETAKAIKAELVSKGIDPARHRKPGAELEPEAIEDQTADAEAEEGNTRKRKYKSRSEMTEEERREDNRLSKLRKGPNRSRGAKQDMSFAAKGMLPMGKGMGKVMGKVEQGMLMPPMARDMYDYAPPAVQMGMVMMQQAMLAQAFSIKGKGKGFMKGKSKGQWKGMMGPSGFDGASGFDGPSGYIPAQKIFKSRSDMTPEEKIADNKARKLRALAKKGAGKGEEGEDTEGLS